MLKRAKEMKMMAEAKECAAKKKESIKEGKDDYLGSIFDACMPF